MSAAPRIPPDDPCAGLRMTAPQFLSLGPTDQRLELVDGVVVVSPSPLPIHQRVAHLIMRAIEDTLPPRARLYHETDVVLAPELVYCPDIVAYAPNRLRGIPASLDVAPDLVVEVLSPENRRKDLVTKRDDYGRFGVAEYWIVEPSDLTVTVLVRQSAEWVPSALRGECLESTAIPGVRVNLAALRNILKAEADNQA